MESFADDASALACRVVEGTFRCRGLFVGGTTQNWAPSEHGRVVSIPVSEMVCIFNYISKNTLKFRNI